MQERTYSALAYRPDLVYVAIFSKKNAHNILSGGFNNQEQNAELGVPTKNIVYFYIIQNTTNANSGYAFEYRIHDARLGRFLSVDPLFKSFSELSVYQFAANNPILAVDIEGLESSNDKNPVTYTVLAGESLPSIAAKLNTTVDNLVAANVEQQLGGAGGYIKTSSNYLIHEGTVIFTETVFGVYKNYTEYSKKLGSMALPHYLMWKHGAWLEGDVLNYWANSKLVYVNGKSRCTDMYHMGNLQRADGFKYYITITERTAFYGWFQKKTAAKGFETMWDGAAFIIAQQMSLTEETLIKKFNDAAVLKFAQDGNKAIFEDVFDNLRDLYNGPVLKGTLALEWDKKTLTHEQRDVVQPIYDKQTPETINSLRELAQGSGWKSAAGSVIDCRFPIGGPLKFEGNIKNWQDRYNHGMNKAVPFYKKYGSIFNWNISGDNRIDSPYDPDNPCYIVPSY